MWPTIQNVIKNDTIKFVLVYSRSIIDAEGNVKDGIDKEISYAESIARDNQLADIIIPLNIDSDAPYNSFIGSNRLTHIPFAPNWAEGLKQLLKKLEKESVPKQNDTTISSYSEWYENEYCSECKILPKKELYYSSWWTFDQLPLKFYMYKFHNLEQAKAIQKANTGVPMSRISNVISSFDHSPNFIVKRETEEIEVKPSATFEVELAKVLTPYESEIFPTHSDIETHFKFLLSRIVEDIFYNKGLRRYKMSNNRFAYYYIKSSRATYPIAFHYPESKKTDKPKKKTPFGKYKQLGNWHYAVSLKPILYPYVGFSLKSHLVFSKNGKPWDDDKMMHTHRRSKGRWFFNEDWRDLQLAFIQGLKDEDSLIESTLSVDGSVKALLKEWPEMYNAEFGYLDPKEKMVMEKIDNYIPIEEEIR